MSRDKTANATSEWLNHRIAHAFRSVGSGTTPNTGNLDYFDGGIPWVMTSDLNDGLLGETNSTLSPKAIADYSALKLWPAGSLVISMYTTGAIGKTAILTRTSTVNQACCVLADGMSLDPRYVQYWFIAHRHRLVAEAQGGAQGNLSQGVIKSQRVFAPSMTEQARIADYLDRETARIDALIEKKERILDLVDLRRRVAIEDSICRDASDLVPLGRFVYEVDERSTDGSGTLLSVSLHLGVVPRNEMTEREGRADDTVGYKLCRQGDLVLNRMRAFQGAVGVAREEGIVSPDYAVLRPVSSDVHPPYLHYLLRTPWFVGKLASIVRGIGSTDLGSTRTPRVNVRDLLRLTGPNASYKVQEARANKADRIMARDSAYLSRLDRSIHLLSERRQALISAAVTGQLDIPEAP